jgi:quercetin dioxygenase-like cupin family protein
VTPRHLVRRAVDGAPDVSSEIAGRSDGFRRWPVVDEKTAPAVHTGFGVCELDPGGRVDAHVHAFEQGLFVLQGEGEIEMGEGALALRAGDYGLIPVGAPHAWRNPGLATLRWAVMSAPQPRSRFGGDTFVVRPLPDWGAIPIDVRDPRTRSFGHIDPETMDVDEGTRDGLTVSASMRTALLVYSGITVKMMIDSDLGAHLHTMFMVQYQPDGFAGPHDHPFEETYLILDGEVDAVFDGAPYRLVAGDVALTGVGCVHEFSNPGDRLVRWLETQAPQPPTRHSYRFSRDWNYLRDALREEEAG